MPRSEDQTQTTSQMGLIKIRVGVANGHGTTLTSVMRTVSAWAIWTSFMASQPTTIRLSKTRGTRHRPGASLMPGSTIAPGPAAATLIDGTYAAYVGGVGGYVFINNLVYLELTGYRTLNYKTLPKLGLDPLGASPFQSVSPYWRVAIEPHWGNHWFEFGAFGMSARVHPFTGATDVNGFPINQTFPQTDRFTDVAFDSQYQYQGPNYWITLRGTYIHENQKLDASSINSGTNPTNTLNTLRAYGSFAYGNDNRIVLSGQYFDTRGSSDPVLYAALNSCQAPDTTCNPNSNGYIAEIAYIPFSSSSAPVWPWANVRVALQYTYYNKFDGTTFNAHNNNTLFLHAWFAM